MEAVTFLKRLYPNQRYRESTSEHDLHLHIFTSICNIFLNLACTLFLLIHLQEFLQAKMFTFYIQLNVYYYHYLEYLISINMPICIEIPIWVISHQSLIIIQVIILLYLLLNKKDCEK